MPTDLNRIRLVEKVVKPIVRKYPSTAYEFEYAFHPDRGWRFDLAWPSEKVALEVEGGVMNYRTRADGSVEYVGGRHTRGKGVIEDMHKYNAATAMGWSVVRVTWRMVDNDIAIVWIMDTLNYRKEHTHV